MASIVDAICEHIRMLQSSAERDQDACSTEYPPLSDADLDQAAARFGYPLPTAVREVYRCVGNGGFGPAYGLLGLKGGMRQEEGRDALSEYESYRVNDADDPGWSWPGGLLPLVHLGCAMYLCVDCTTDDGKVLWFEPNVHSDEGSWDDSFFPLHVTFAELMIMWASGQSVDVLMERASRNPTTL